MKKEKASKEVKKELKELGSRLPGASRKPDFEVPADYFEQLPGKIQDRIMEKERRHVTVFAGSLYRKLIPAMAAVLLLALVTYSLLFTGQNGTDDFIASDNWYPDAALEYFAYQPGFDNELLYEVILESDISTDDILYEAEFAIFDDDDDYDELLEILFENASYYGIESGYLISYLD